MRAVTVAASALLSILALGCAATARVRVSGSGGAPIDGAIVFWDATSIFKHVGRQTEIVVCDTNGFALIRGGPNHLVIGKVGYYPSTIYLAAVPRLAEVTLYATNETAFCLERNPLDDAVIYRKPYLVRTEQTDAYRLWGRYLEWLQLQPRLLSQDVTLDGSGTREERPNPPHDPR